MFEYSKNNLKWVTGLLRDLPDAVYDRPNSLLSEATIGQHVRHIVEIYQELLRGYQTGTIEYDNRKRDYRIETQVAFAETAINEIINSLERTDKPLQIIYQIEGQKVELSSNYNREIMYNLEHAIHHMALIKVAVLDMTDMILPKEFGVAPTTLQYRAQCVQ